MKFDNLEKYLDEFSRDVKDEYINYLKKQDYRIAQTITTRVEQFGNKYIVYMNLAEYWKYIEYGRKPGKRPPINAILKWIKDKGITPRGGIKISDKSLAFVISRSIGEKGIKPRPVLFEKIVKEQNFEQNVLNALRKDIKADIDEIKNWNKK
jgi:hypothetical protein